MRRHLTTAFACLTVSFALSVPAQAQSLPRYDVEAYCRTVAEVSGGSAMIFNGCIDMEQDAYDGLKRDWAGVPQSTREYCDMVAGVSGHSYSILAGCVDIETDAAGAPSVFTY